MIVDSVLLVIICILVASNLVWMRRCRKLEGFLHSVNQFLEMRWP